MNRPRLAKIRRRWIGCTLILLACSAAAADEQSGDHRLGAIIYQQGRLPDGSLLEATVSGDVPIRGKIASCAQCHRNSGYGSDEPGKMVPAIVGERLFSFRFHDRGEEIRSLYQEPQTNVESTEVRIPRNRAAYTAESLLESLRSGHDPNGRAFNALQPRFQISDIDGRHLVAYLRTLGQHPPGIENDVIHFATVVTDDVPRETAEAYLRVVETFIEIRNRETRRYQSRPNLSPHYKADQLHSYRRWQLHVWRLSGNEADWPLQLVTHYQRTPVFALLGGLSTRNWASIHRFCEFREIPCLFPQTPIPELNARSGSTIYFDRGIFAEAAAIARACKKAKHEDAPTGISLVRGDPVLAQKFAQALRIGLRDHGCESVPVCIVDWKKTMQIEPEDARHWKIFLLDRNQLAAELSNWKSAQNVYVSASLLGEDDAREVSEQWSVNVMSPYVAATTMQPRRYRLLSWFRSRRIELSEPSMQLKTHFMLSVTSHAIGHLVGRHSRAYLLERIEHETENALNPGLFSQLSLGPGQRFAAGSGGELVAASIEAIAR